MIKYTTKRDTNGNRYTLIIDHVTKSFTTDYNTSRCYDDYITISKRDRKKLIDNLLLNNYTWNN